MHIRSYIWKSLKSVGAIFIVIAEFILLFIPPLWNNKLASIPYIWCLEVLLLVLLIIGTLVNMVFRLYKAHVSSVPIANCILRDDRPLLIINYHPAFSISAIVTVYRMVEVNTSPKDKLNYEKPFAVGYVEYIQSNGLIQIVLDGFLECTTEEENDLLSCSINLMKQLIVRPYAHKDYFLEEIDDA